ncbi:hypothetical protein LTR70_009692 [Exophiala xenobiotica]|uniref:Uncharacterized protein n=1 Tax=Lithohypha guttulata TaxID=1690604 RepID=A0ABR0JXH8_9EURO|nr:hypothetical protein LTR24_009568 [Lithohypha guttulata]KAK5310157.1 hypothetical protein LTR70_009692 [Exophiala xenobiotica]
MSEETAELSPEGLACQLAVCKFPSTVAPAFENSSKALYQIATDENHNIWDIYYGITVRTYCSRWLICVFEEPWHQMPVHVPEGAIPAILLEQPTYMLDGSRPTESFAGDNISALFVYYTPSPDGNNQQAHTIRHCSLYFQSHKQCVFLEELDTITHQLMDEYWDGLIARSEDWDKLYEFIEPLVPNYILRSPCLKIGKRALKAVRGTDDIDDQAMDHIMMWTTIVSEKVG